MTDMIDRVARAIEDGAFDAGHEISGVAAVRAARFAVETIWKEINTMVVTGPLPGDGTDKQAERNGIVRVCNRLFSELGAS